VTAEKKPDFQVVNHSVPRRDGRVKVTGRATFVSDLRLIGMAYAKVLRSPYAHAKIVSIDTSRAEARRGVYCILITAMPSKITRCSPSRKSATLANR